MAAARKQGATIGGLESQVKGSFDKIQQELGAASANETLAALIECHSEKKMMDGCDDFEVAGMREARLIWERAFRHVVAVLVHRHEAETEAVAAATERSEELEAALAERDRTILEQAERAAEQNEKIEGLEAKAASVDKLADALRDAEAAAGERERKQTERFTAAMMEAEAAAEARERKQAERLVMLEETISALVARGSAPADVPDEVEGQTTLPV